MPGKTLLPGVLLAVVLVISANGQTPSVPRPVRNDRAQTARELLVLRHHQLRKGGHEEFYRLSADNVWPGVSAPGGPYFMPGLNEQYDRISAGQRPPAGEQRIPVRLDVAQPGDEIVEVR